MSTIGSSEAAVCLGLQRRAQDGTPYTSALELWARLTGAVPRYEPAGPVAELGNWLEPACLLRYQAHTGHALQSGPPLEQPGWSVPGLPFLHARPDAVDSVDGCVVEAKCPLHLDPERWGPAGGDEVPAEHWVQVAVQVAIGRRLHGMGGHARLAAMARDPGGRHDKRGFVVYDLDIDERRERKVLDAIRDWHQTHVVEGHPPRPDGSESAGRALRRMFQPSTDVAVEADARVVELVHKLVQLVDAANERSMASLIVAQEIQQFMGAATVLRDGRRTLITWRPDRNGRRRWVVKQGRKR